VEDREPGPETGHLRGAIQVAAEEGHAAELEPRGSQVVHAPPQKLPHAPLLERLAKTLAERTHFIGPGEPRGVLARERSSHVVEGRVTR